MAQNITIALAGNPNSGKTTLFNSLTGAHQHVGNWPGVTIEKKEGQRTFQRYSIRVVDLPGVYSLTAYSPDEIIARDFIVDEKPDVVINVIDASSLERNLYLTVQLLEMGVPLILVLNMMDVAEAKGHHINIEALAQETGVPVIPIVATRSKGLDELLNGVVRLGGVAPAIGRFKINYGEEIESEIAVLEKVIMAGQLGERFPARWLAIKLLEEDQEIADRFSQEVASESILKARDESLAHLKSIYGDEAVTVIADARYGFITGLLKDILAKPAVEKPTFSDKLDKILVNRWLGIPILLLVIFGLFQFVFTLSAPLMDWISQFFDWLGVMASGLSPEWLGSLVSNGVIGGVGSVLVFIPPIFLMFIAISILEDCGYMARAAFVTDKVMHKIGLHGRSFIPMVLGFGCSIPGIMACRTIDNPRDRLATILITPFMSCGARLPIYVLLAGAFFPRNQGLVVFSMYLIGALVALAAGFILRKSLFRGTSSHFVMELPPYRLPTLNGLAVHTWQRGKSFLVKAGTVIFGIVFIVWLLSSLPWGVEYASPDSFTGHIGRFIAPVLAPAGFGQWQAAISLLFGFLAKEVVVGTMGSIFAADTGSLGATIAAQMGWTPLIAFSFMVFCLLYVPCAASVATIRAETGSWKWAGFAVVYTTAVAWVAATLIFQVGSLFA